MARTNPNGGNMPVNPAKMFAEWSGKYGKFSFWDKESDAEDKNTDLPDKFTFIVLDELTTIKGYDKQNKCNIFSNEIRNTKKDKLLVKSFKGGEIAEGFYDDIKDRLTAKKAKYCKSVYIAYKIGDAFEIGNIQFYGSSLGGWFTFCKKHRNAVYTKAIRFAGKHEDTEGDNTFWVPDFELVDISPETDDIAGELQKVVEAYMVEYLEKSKIGLTGIEQAEVELKEEERLKNVERHARRPGEEGAMMDKHFNDSHIPDEGYVTPKEDLPASNSLTGHVPDSDDGVDVPF